MTETLDAKVARLMLAVNRLSLKEIEAALRTELSAPAVQGEAQVCCDNPSQCLRPCTPRGEWLARQPALTQPTATESSFERMFNAACVDLGLINEALGLDPEDGGAEPILEAIGKLKAAAQPVATDWVKQMALEIADRHAIKGDIARSANLALDIAKTFEQAKPAIGGEVTDAQIERLALENGFKLKEQSDGSMALNLYVFNFARALIAATSTQPASETDQPGLPKHNPRRLYDNDVPDGYLESDTDYFENNRELGVALLDAYGEGSAATPPPVAGDARMLLIESLVASKGWNYGYAAAFVDDWFHARVTPSKQEGV